MSKSHLYIILAGAAKLEDMWSDDAKLTVSEQRCVDDRFSGPGEVTLDCQLVDVRLSSTQVEDPETRLLTINCLTPDGGEERNTNFTLRIYGRSTRIPHEMIPSTPNLRFPP